MAEGRGVAKPLDRLGVTGKRYLFILTRPAPISRTLFTVMPSLSRGGVFVRWEGQMQTGRLGAKQAIGSRPNLAVGFNLAVIIIYAEFEQANHQHSTT